jgi:hypothetical protein
VGETAAETAREVAALRAETERLLDALESQARRTLDVRRQVATHPIVVAAVGLVAVLTVLGLWYRSYRRAQEARRPVVRLRRGAAALGEEARTRARRVGRALSGEAEEAKTREAEAQDASLPQKLLGTMAATATLALVDQVTRWLSKRQSGPTREAPPA